MYGIRILNVAEHSKANQWKLYEVACEFENEVEEQAKITLGLMHQQLDQRKKVKLGRLKRIKELWPINDDEKDILITNAAMVGSALAIKPKCKFNERMLKREADGYIPEGCLDDAKRLAVCLAFENGKISKQVKPP